MDLDLRIVSREINEILWKSEKTLATAESCTAGRIATALTAIPGSSNYFKGGIVCYADEVKAGLLGVEKAVIEEQTAVCEEVVKQLVIGAIRTLNTDYAVSVSGFAGPDGGTATVLVGTVWIAVGDQTEVVTQKIEGDEGRDKNLTKATNIAMHMLLDFLRRKEQSAEE